VSTEFLTGVIGDAFQRAPIGIAGYYQIIGEAQNKQKL